MKKTALLIGMLFIISAAAGCAEPAATGGTATPAAETTAIPSPVSTQVDAAPTATPPQTPEPTASGTTEPTDTAEPTTPHQTPLSGIESIYSELPIEFSFLSGVGAWSTTMHINADGSFEGYYLDMNLGETGDDYAEGTWYMCSFTGQFADLQQISEYEYSMRVSELKLMEEAGKEQIMDGTKIVHTEPYGFEDAEEFRLYLPGRQTADLPPEYIDWAQAGMGWEDGAIPAEMPCHGLYNVSGGKGFIS